MTNKIKIEDILNTNQIEEVYKEYKYFPFHLLDQDECNLQFVLGVRGDGKTYNAKKYILKDWYEKGIKSYWVVPTKTEMEEMVATKDFHQDLYDDENEDIQEFLERTTMEGEFLKEKKEGNEDNEWFMRVIPLSMYHKYKKGKHPKVHRMYFDEFMRENYLKNEAFKTMDLLVSVQREKQDFKFTFLGNAISLNHPMFVNIGVYELEEGKVITTINNPRTNTPIAKIWNWKRPPQDAEEKNAGLLWYELGELTGYNDYAVKNEFKNDNMSNIIPPNKVDLSIALKSHTLDLGEVIVEIWYIPKQHNSTGEGIYYIKATKDKEAVKEIKYAIHQDYVRDNVIFKKELATNLAIRLQKNILYYDSIVAKQALWLILKKYV